jgi:hypothetical protein
MLRVPIASDQEPWTQGLEKGSVGGRRRSVVRRTVDGRHRQRPWKGFKVDSNSLQFVGLEAEVFVVT